MINELTIYERSTWEFTEMSDYDLLYLVQDILKVLEDLVSCLVPQRGRLFRLFAGMTRTLKGAFAELRRRRVILGPKVVSITQGDLIAKTIKEKAEWIRKARTLQREVKTAKKIQDPRPSGAEVKVQTERVPQSSVDMQVEMSSPSNLGLTERVIKTFVTGFENYINRRIETVREKLLNDVPVITVFWVRRFTRSLEGVL